MGLSWSSSDPVVSPFQPNEADVEAYQRADRLVLSFAQLSDPLNESTHWGGPVRYLKAYTVHELLLPSDLTQQESKQDHKTTEGQLAGSIELVQRLHIAVPGRP